MMVTIGEGLADLKRADESAPAKAEDDPDTEAEAEASLALRLIPKLLSSPTIVEFAPPIITVALTRLRAKSLRSVE